MPQQEIPLFPLNTVLFPGGVLPLRIFEPRYIDMIRRCMGDGGSFGVVLIREGSESGGRAISHEVGTLAVIVDFDQLADGLLGITARGTQRFRVLSTQIQADGLQIATIELAKPDFVVPLPKEWVAYAQMLEQALPQMGNFFKHLQPQYNDTAWVVGRLSEVLPIPLPQRQQLLELDDPRERLAFLQPWLQKSND